MLPCGCLPNWTLKHTPKLQAPSLLLTPSGPCLPSTFASGILSLLGILSCVLPNPSPLALQGQQNCPSPLWLWLGPQQAFTECQMPETQSSRPAPWHGRRRRKAETGGKTQSFIGKTEVVQSVPVRATCPLCCISSGSSASLSALTQAPPPSLVPLYSPPTPHRRLSVW